MYVAIWTAISLSLFVATAASGAECRVATFENRSFTICEADPRTEQLQLFLDDDDGRKLGTFERLDAHLEKRDLKVVFATNGGMYHDDRRPVGLFVEDGKEISRIVTREGPGNFGLLPNGVLCISELGASIIESRQFADSKPECRFATQSGPMLVIDGELHPKFLPNSTSRFIRNGVGVTPEGKFFAVISDQPVNFHLFARVFRDHIGIPNALFIDGNVSRLYAPEVERRDFGFPMGPMLVVSEPSD